MESLLLRCYGDEPLTPEEQFFVKSAIRRFLADGSSLAVSLELKSGDLEQSRNNFLVKAAEASTTSRHPSTMAIALGREIKKYHRKSEHLAYPPGKFSDCEKAIFWAIKFKGAKELPKERQLQRIIEEGLGYGAITS